MDICGKCPGTRLVLVGEWMRDPEEVKAFRAKLRKEMFGSQIWYHPNKEKKKYTFTFHTECPYATTKKGKVAEHRYIWWLNHPDDPIEYNDTIIHKNGNTLDNRIENLEKVKMKQAKRATDI